MRKCESPPEKVQMMTLACIVLHNICIDRGDTLSTQLDLIVDPRTNNRRDRNIICRLLNMRSCQRVRDNSCQVTRIRDALVRKLWREKRKVLV